MSVQLSVRIGLIGPGLIGSALLRQLAHQASYLKEAFQSDVAVVAVANSRHMLLAEDRLDLTDVTVDLATKGQPVNLDRFTSTVQAGRGASRPCCVIIDCTAAEAIPDEYINWAKRGLDIITPNKKFGAGPYSRYQALQQVCRSSHVFYRYEATVGAGLPVVSTLRSLIDTGDKVLKVEGILSGTLSYIFNTYKSGASFSDVVADAKAKGYTEPDPREDLSGMDVARKVVILARECGLAVELSSVPVESLVPKPLETCATVDEFMEMLPQYDELVAKRALAAEACGEVVRYVGCVDVLAGTATVTLTSYPAAHPFAQLSGSDNILAFTTERYKERPLIVRGPGAGAEVTAAGIFADLLHIISCRRGCLC